MSDRHDPHDLIRAIEGLRDALETPAVLGSADHLIIGLPTEAGIRLETWLTRTLEHQTRHIVGFSARDGVVCDREGRLGPYREVELVGVKLRWPMPEATSSIAAGWAGTRWPVVPY